MTQTHDPGQERDVEQYATSYLNDYSFEAYMVSYRQQMLLNRIDHHKPNSILEIGCGLDLLYEKFIVQSRLDASWLIVEPSSEFSKRASQKYPDLTVINNTFEQSIQEIRQRLIRQPDLIICSGLLHEVSRPNQFLKGVRSLMGKNTVLHVNVPNSESFHRKLAIKMNLIQDTRELSKRNMELQQGRVYNLERLNIELKAINLDVVETGGYLVKPFTHEQMSLVVAVMDRSVLDGLFLLGVDYPELASEIWAEGRLLEDAPALRKEVHSV